MTAILTVAAFLLFVSLFALAARYGTKLAGSKLGSKIDRLHREGEHIMDTGRAPAHWLRRGSAGEASPLRVLYLERVARYKLRRLIRYFELTPVFTDVESREYVVGELRQVLSRWRAAGFKAIYGEPPNEEADQEPD